MPAWILVFIGGGFGSLVRYGLSVHYNDSLSMFSLGTLIANVCSCFVLGCLLGMKESGFISSNISLFLATGFCGGFSTFSTFSAELMFLSQDKGIEQALIYLALSILLGVFMVYFGYKICNNL